MPAHELSPLVRDLSDARPAVRQSAALAIFRVGWELAQAAIQAWSVDPELAAECVRDRSGWPILTVGLAVHPERFEQIRRACGSPRLADVPPDQDAREFALEFPGGARLDVLTTARPHQRGAIARFLEKSGESIQQVEVRVQDVDRMTERLRARWGVSPIYPTTRPGADGTRVNFFLLPAGANRKVLIELVEGPPLRAPEILK